ncbi:MAG: hypothetical protein H6829_07225 [Planctomycetes bacterium]|nr:hypothetical protein [Planctomycetota bacterium]HPF12675.1 hypothetical protein [Planctomycetota bacterium]
MTATTAVTPSLFVGVEFNPLENDLGLLANWRVFDETEQLPALIVGTSSDRIGTPSGRAYYATLSKDLSGWTGLPVAPYVGLAFGEYDDAWETIGGMAIRWMPRVSSTHSWDGHNLHHQLDYAPGNGQRLGIVVAQQGSKQYVGVSLGTSW